MSSGLPTILEYIVTFNAFKLWAGARTLIIIETFLAGIKTNYESPEQGMFFT